MYNTTLQESCRLARLLDSIGLERAPRAYIIILFILSNGERSNYGRGEGWFVLVGRGRGAFFSFYSVTCMTSSSLVSSRIKD